jgi:hypothetical protein
LEVLEKKVKYRTTLGVAAIAGLLNVGSSAAIAQEVQPTYKADPSVYKVIFENENFRVIEARKAKGQRDKAHSHPVPSIVYFLTDCNEKLAGANGQTRNASNKAGTVQAPPTIKSHTSENVGASECHQIFVERK